ncbi:MAG: hypothetical protein AAFR28_04820 [Pseudomonadota bacterium]
MAAKRPPKRLPLPKRFNAALTDDAYARLRELNAAYGLGNNYLLTVLLERLDQFADPAKLDAAYQDFIAEYGAPPPPKECKAGGDRPNTARRTS